MRFDFGENVSSQKGVVPIDDIQDCVFKVSTKNGPVTNESVFPVPEANRKAYLVADLPAETWFDQFFEALKKQEITKTYFDKPPEVFKCRDSFHVYKLAAEKPCVHEIDIFQIKGEMKSIFYEWPPAESLVVPTTKDVILRKGNQLNFSSNCDLFHYRSGSPFNTAIDNIGDNWYFERPQWQDWEGYRDPTQHRAKVTESLRRRLEDPEKADSDPFWNAIGQKSTKKSWSESAPNEPLEKRGLHWYPKRLLVQIESLEILKNKSIPPVVPVDKAAAEEILSNLENTAFIEKLLRKSWDSKKDSLTWKNSDRLQERIRAIEDCERRLQSLAESDVEIPKSPGSDPSYLFMSISKQHSEKLVDNIFKSSRPSTRGQRMKAREARSNRDTKQTKVLISWDFGSYISIANNLRKDLTGNTFDVRLDTNWINSPEFEIDEATVIMPVLSTNYELNEVCMMELDKALELQKNVVPVICEKGYNMNEKVAKKIANTTRFDFAETNNRLVDRSVYERTLKSLIKKLEEISEKRYGNVEK